jgi:hypothetical protein
VADVAANIVPFTAMAILGKFTPREQVPSALPQNGSRLITKIETMAMTAMAFCAR